MTLSPVKKNYWNILNAKINDNGEILGTITLDLLHGGLGIFGVNTDQPNLLYLKRNTKTLGIESKMGSINV